MRLGVRGSPVRIRPSRPIFSVLLHARRLQKPWRTDSCLPSFAIPQAASCLIKWVVQFDSSFGYPVQADLDPDPRTVDDELFFRVTALKPLP